MTFNDVWLFIFLKEEHTGRKFQENLQYRRDKCKNEMSLTIYVIRW